MNLLAATTLSTQKKARCQYLKTMLLFISIIQYVFIVQKLDEDNYQLQIYHVTYPDAQKEKGWGKPHTAEQPHFEKQFTLEELKTFMKKREWSIDEGWQSVEDDAESVV